MIRLFQNRVADILMLLTSLKGHAGNITADHAARSYYNGDYGNAMYDSLDQGVRDKLNRVSKSTWKSETTLNQVINELVTQYDADRVGETSYNDLIDDLARILQMPKAQFMMTNQMLRALQQAILIPDEIREFRKATRAGGMCCNGCNRDIDPGEMVSTDVGGDGVPMLFCSLCRTPEVVPCYTCKKPVGFRQFVPGNNHYCEEHKPNAKKKAEPAAVRFEDRDTSPWRRFMLNPATPPPQTQTISVGETTGNEVTWRAVPPAPGTPTGRIVLDPAVFREMPQLRTVQDEVRELQNLARELGLAGMLDEPPAAEDLER